MKTTVFSRILLATLLPVLIIFALVFLLIREIVNDGTAIVAKETTYLVTKLTSRRITNQLAEMTTLLHITAADLSAVDYRSREAKRLVYEEVRGLLDAAPKFYMVVVAFEPDIFPGEGRFQSTLLQEDGKVREMSAVTPGAPEDPGRSAWYAHVLQTGEPYLNILGNDESEGGEKRDYAGIVIYPIRAGNRVIGCVGLGIHYSSMLKLNDLQLAKDQQYMLLSSDGNILFSPGEAEVGRNILSYDFSNKQKITEALHSQKPLLEESVSPFSSEKILLCLQPIPIANTNQTIYLYLSRPADELHASAASSIQSILGISLFGLLLLSGTIFYATGKIVRPIKALSTHFSQATKGDGSLVFDSADTQRPQSNGVVEVDILQAALQKMLAQIVQEQKLRAQTAETQRENKTLVASSEAKTKFFANMSHEIRTPMNAILGISEILLYDSQLSEEQRKYIKDIRVSADALLTIINDILDISKMESGKMILIPDNFNLRVMLDNICSLALYLTAEKHLAFHYKTEGEIPLCLYGDDVRLRQILLNILSNAVKFTHEGYVDLRVVVGADTLSFIFTDTGVGIPQEEQALLFQPFSQADTTANRKVKGTGLGLSISKNLAEAMGGRIELESAPGKGSTFTVILPKVLGDETALTTHAATVGVRYDPSVRVLIVDDNEINLNVAHGLLKTLHGIDGDLAHSGPEAIEKARQKDYDLIFMDHMMPGMDGVVATRHIRALGPRHALTPIIALTANAMAGVKDLLITSGMSGFLAKPILKPDLADILYAWLPESKRILQPAAEKNAPTDIAPGTLLEKMRAIEKIDLDIGLDAVAGQKDVYEQSLRLMNDKIPKVTRLIAELLEQENIQEFAVHVHGMKSSLATIGAMSLSRQALALEKAATEGDIGSARDLSPSFIRQLGELGRQLSEVLENKESATEKPRGDTDTFEKGVEELRRALAQHDHEAIGDCLLSLRSRDYGDAANTLLARLQEHADAFDYEAATEDLNALMR